MKNVSVFLFVLALCCMIIGNACGEKTRIYFRNGLGYKNWLKVQCKYSAPIKGAGWFYSGDKYLRPGGKDYVLSFENMASRDQICACTLSKGPDYKTKSVFAAYVQFSDEGKGPSFNFLAKDDGIYHSNIVENKLHKKFFWNERLYVG